MKIKKTKKITKTFKSRTDIEKEFVKIEDAILRVSFQDALLINQQLILGTLLDIRDLLIKTWTYLYHYFYIVTVGCDITKGVNDESYFSN